MHEIRLFIASSNEIEELRRDLVVRITGKNKLLKPRGQRIDIDEWKFESSVIPETGRIQPHRVLPCFKLPRGQNQWHSAFR
jgi:hypothetical protein